MLEHKNVNKSNNISPQNQTGKTGIGDIASLFVFALFWNGFVVFVYIQMLLSFLSGSIQLFFILLFLTPFIGVGIGHLLIPLILVLLKSFGLINFAINPNLNDLNPPPGLPPISFWGGFVQLIVASTIIISSFFPSIMQFKDIRKWEPIPCEITSSKVIELQGERNKQYTIDVLYHYQYYRKEYTGRKFSVSQPALKSRESIEKLAKKYPEGSMSICYVNPSKPEEAVLSRDIRGIKFARGGMSGILFIGGALFFGAGMRKWVKDNRPKTNRYQRPERILFWSLLLLGWGIFSTGMIIGEICQNEVESGIASSPGIGTILFFGITGVVFLYKLLYNILKKWDKVIKLSQDEFYTMYRQVKKNKGEDEKESP